MVSEEMIQFGPDEFDRLQRASEYYLVRCDATPFTSHNRLSASQYCVLRGGARLCRHTPYRFSSPLEMDSVFQQTIHWLDYLRKAEHKGALWQLYYRAELFVQDTFLTPAANGGL